ncbi:CBS domain-containing protein [Reinekea marina]|uniref:CBS domain-containing protein n=1 Tax=Reinekea marina TaxID=1310421 RepID=A0ABV7WXN7_9GAMM|nr:CBS domain-containing protein [Reinekea marina]MBU2862435.1 CBS domain-containing protein [Reinekea forsetii]MDN3649990.1 CBS domain-containing protein [Reinekea marina]
MSNNAITVADCMVPARLTVTPQTTIRKAVEEMLRTQLISAPVVDEKGMVCGYISEQDCLRHMISGSYYNEESGLVSDVMQHEVLFAESSMDIIDLAHLMCGAKPKKYPVCEDGKLVGVITRSHIMKALLESTED